MPAEWNTISLHFVDGFQNTRKKCTEWYWYRLDLKQDFLDFLKNEGKLPSVTIDEYRKELEENRKELEENRKKLLESEEKQMKLEKALREAKEEVRKRDSKKL